MLLTNFLLVFVLYFLDVTVTFKFGWALCKNEEEEAVATSLSYLKEKNFSTSKYEYNTTFFTYYAFFFCFFSCFNSLHNLIRVTFWCGWTIECLVPSLFFSMLSSFVFGGFLINLCSIFASSNKSFLIRNNNNKSLSRPMVWYLRAGFRICFCRTELNQIVIYQFNSVRSKSKNLTGQEIESIGYVFDATQNRKLN